MRIAVWNCNMRLHDKFDRLAALHPDLAVVPECACPEVLLRRELDPGPSDFAWDGANPAKGLGVLAFGPWRLEVDRVQVPRSGTTLALNVFGPATLRLLAVWALPPRTRRDRGPAFEPLADALARLAPFLAGSPTIIAGDFNHVLLTRRTAGRRRPSRLARHLAALEFVSSYHHVRGVEHGAEPEPTFFLHRRPPGRHADHVFVDRGTVGRLRGATVGPAEVWVPLSDHVPVVVELDGEWDVRGGRATCRRAAGSLSARERECGPSVRSPCHLDTRP